MSRKTLSKSVYISPEGQKNWPSLLITRVLQKCNILKLFDNKACNFKKNNYLI